MFKYCNISGCDCWDKDDFRIVKQKSADVYNAYKQTYAAVKDENGNKTGEMKPTGNYRTVQMVDGKAKTYTTLDAAMVDCV